METKDPSQNKQSRHRKVSDDTLKNSFLAEIESKRAENEISREGNQISKVANWIAAVALFLSLGSIVLSVVFSSFQSHLSNSIATFDSHIQNTQVALQSTSIMQSNQQTDFQETVQANANFQYNQQSTLAAWQQAQMDAWARQENLPAIKTRQPSDQQNQLTSVKIQGNEIVGNGSIEFFIDNVGGGQAIIDTIDFTDQGTPVPAITSIEKTGEKIYFGNTDLTQEKVIPPRTPIKIHIDMEARTSVYSSERIQSQSEYQLGKHLIEQLQPLLLKDPIQVNFSGGDPPINIQISNIQLTMPETSFEPIPPSLFFLSNKAITGEACFKPFIVSLTHKQVDITNIENNQHVSTPGNDLSDKCYTFPVGTFRFSWYPDNSINHSVQQIDSVAEDGLTDIILPNYSQTCLDIKAPQKSQVTIKIENLTTGDTIEDTISGGKTCIDIPVGSYNLQWYVEHVVHYDQKPVNFSVEIGNKNLVYLNSNTSIMNAGFSSRENQPNKPNNGGFWATYSRLFGCIGTVFLAFLIFFMFRRRRDEETDEETEDKK